MEIGHVGSDPARRRPDEDRGSRGGPGGPAPQHLAPDGPGGPGAVPRDPPRHRPGHRRRLLLRFPVGPHLFRRGPRPHRGEDARAGRGRPAVRAGRDFPGGSRARLPGDGRGPQVRAHRRESRRDPVLLPARQALRLLPRPARALQRPPPRLQAPVAGRLLLAGRRAPAAAPAHLRHGLLHPGGAGRLPGLPRGGQAARPPPARQGPGPVQHPGDRRRRLRLLASPGGIHPRDDRELLEGGAPAPRLRAGQHPPHRPAQPLGDLGALLTTTRRTCTPSASTRRSTSSSP